MFRRMQDMIKSNPDIWGPNDNLSFNPARWLPADHRPGEPAKIKEAPQGAFLAWSAGPRNCPGQKFSQVEFTAVVAEVFRRCSVEPRREPDESADAARERLKAVLDDAGPVLTLQIKNPDALKLRFVPR